MPNQVAHGGSLGFYHTMNIFILNTTSRWHYYILLNKQYGEAYGVSCAL